MYKIAFVDDDIKLVELSNKIFLKNNLNLFYFNEGVKFLDFVKRNKVNLAIIDVELRDFNGIDILKLLRLKDKDINIIMISGLEIDEFECYKFGADYFIKKPILWQELIARVKNFIERDKYFKGISPLTDLPSSIFLEKYIRNLIENKEVFVYMDLDIDSFRKINEIMGYEFGDFVLKKFSLNLEEIIKDYKYSLAAHINGNNFSVICRWEEWNKIANEISKLFYFNFYKVLKSKIRSNITLSISCVSNKYRKITNYGQIISISSEIKKYLKSFVPRKYNMILFDRRKN
ncbi:MAG: response regulator [Elusimicrobiales bacterium]|nr:response regulator [Elusimicrobiales bacterium]